MASFKQYETQSGEQRWLFILYGGIDSQTGKAKQYKRRGFKTQKKASLAASRLELELANGNLEKENNILFSTVYKQWYAAYINTVAESTYARTANLFANHIIPEFGKYRIRTINSAQIQRVVNKWFKQVTINYKRWYYYTNMVFKFAIKQGYVKQNPCDRVVLPKRKAKAGDAVENFWDKQELETFFSYIDQHKELEKYTLFRVLAFCGVRRGECLALTWSDISFKDNTMRINKTLTQGVHGKQIIQAPKTKNSRRTIDLDQTTIAYLKQWRARQQRKYLILGINTLKPDQLIFSNANNSYYVLHRPSEWLRSIEKKHNIKHRITIHGFRHSHCSALFAAGATIKEVQLRLGHADIKTTMNIYAHVTKKQNEEVAKKLVNYLNF